jgi:hypothetical protein
VTFPEPREGLVIRHSYLWSREHQAGQEEGIKDRPCAIIISIMSTGGRQRVLVAPVTHSPPDNPAEETKKRLGLDAERSWIVVSEANRFTWPGPDLRPIPGRDLSTIAYGMLPPTFFRQVRDAFLARFTHGSIASVPRTE